MSKKTNYEKDCDRIKELCSGIDCDSDRICDILIDRDYVNLPSGFVDSLEAIASQLEDLRTDID